jgi:predicted MFS family arabinose efflux permease
MTTLTLAEGPDPVGASAWRRHAVIALIAFLTLVDLFATQAILPALAARYGVAPAAMGLAVNASTLGMAVASLAMAFLSRRIDRRRGTVMALAILAIPTLLLALAPGLASFAALRIVQGLLMATAFTLTLAYLGETMMGMSSAGAFAAYIAGNVASNVFGRLIAGGVADHFGLTTTFMVFAGMNLAGALLVRLAFAGAGRPALAAAPPAFAALKAELANPRLVIGLAIGFMILFAFLGTFTFVNFVLVAPPLGLDVMAIGVVYLIFLPSIPTTLLAGRAVARFGTRAALVGALGVALAALPLLVLPSLPLVAAGLTLVAAGTFFAQAVATGHAGRSAKGDRGAASGLYLAAYFTGGLVGTAILGFVFDRFGWPATVAGVGGALLAAIVLALRLDETERAEAR